MGCAACPLGRHLGAGFIGLHRKHPGPLDPGCLVLPLVPKGLRREAGAGAFDQSKTGGRDVWLGAGQGGDLVVDSYVIK